MYIIKAYTFLFSISFLLSFNNSEIIKNDFKIFMNSSSSESINLDKKNSKNIFLGTALSAIIPGAGQMYNKDYKRGYAYLSIELLSAYSNKETLLIKSFLLNPLFVAFISFPLL